MGTATQKVFEGTSPHSVLQPTDHLKLNSYLADIDRQAEEMFSRLIKQMAGREGVTEELKEQDQMALVDAMNNIWNRIAETINVNIICN